MDSINTNKTKYTLRVGRSENEQMIEDDSQQEKIKRKGRPKSPYPKREVVIKIYCTEEKKKAFQDYCFNKGTSCSDYFNKEIDTILKKKGRKHERTTL